MDFYIVDHAKIQKSFKNRILADAALSIMGKFCSNVKFKFYPAELVKKSTNYLEPKTIKIMFVLSRFGELISKLINIKQKKK